MRNLVLINFVVTLAVTHSINDQSINVALETILEFDGKERVSDLKFIDQMQSFLKNIEKTMDKQRVGMGMRSQYKKKKRKQKKRVKEIEAKGPEKDKNISEYFSHIADVLSSFDRREVFAVFKTVEDEIKKRHKKDRKFNELLENPNIRRSITSGLQTVKQASSSILDAISKHFVSSVETQNYLQNLSTKFYSWLDMFYHNKPPTSDKFHEIIQELDNYSSSKQKPKGKQIILENEEDHSSNEQKRKKKKNSFDKDKNNDTKDIGNIGTLVNLVKKAMNSLFFDSYLQMDQDSRITVQEQLQNFVNDDQLKEHISHEEDVSLNTKEAIMADTKHHISNNIETRLQNIQRHLAHSHFKNRGQARQLNYVFDNTWLTNSTWGNMTNWINGTYLNGTNPNSTRGNNTMLDFFFPHPAPKNKSTNTIFGYKPKRHKESKNRKKRRRPKLIEKTGKRSHKKYSQKKYSKHYKKKSGGKKSKNHRKYSPNKESNELKTLDTTAKGTIKPINSLDNVSDLSLKNKIKSQESIEYVGHKGYFKKTLHTEDSTDVSSKMTEEIATTPKKENKGKIKKSKKTEHKNQSKKSKEVKRRKEKDPDEIENEAAKQTTSDGQKIVEDKLNNRKISENFTKPALTETNLRTENTLGKETKHDDSNSVKQETTVVWVPRAELKHDTSTDLIVKRNDSARLDNNWSIKNEVHSRTNQEEEHSLKTGDHNQTELVPDKKISASITNTSKDSCSNMTCMATTETVNNTNTQRVNSTTTDSGNTTLVTVDTFIVYKTLTPDKHKILSVVQNMTNKSELILYDDKDFLEAPPNQTVVTDNRTPTTKI